MVILRLKIYLVEGIIMSKGDKERKEMPTIQEKLAEANKKVDARIDDIWKQAEENLKIAEAEFNERRKKK